MMATSKIIGQKNQGQPVLDVMSDEQFDFTFVATNGILFRSLV